MNFLLNLSFRYKIPLWGSLLIVTATVGVSGILIAQSYDHLRTAMLSSSASLGRTLSRTLFTAIQHDEVWQAFEIIRAPLHGDVSVNPIRPEMILALDRKMRVFATSHPKKVPMLSEFRRIDGEHAQLADLIEARSEPEAPIMDFIGVHRIYVAIPIADEGARLGTLIIVHTKEAFFDRFRNVALRSATGGLLVLAILLPLNWYWGRRTTVPLVELARSAGDVARGALREPPPGSYPYRDELGQLFDAFGVMVRALREKADLEQEMIRSERLAAVGRLSAGLAHEINNPLGGMLVALDNFKHRAGNDERTLKTVAMIERGLSQIRDTVSAMMVAAKVKSRDFVPHDVEDVQLLLSGEAHKHSATLRVEHNIEQPIALPATLIRQILMNLMLNGLQASDPSGTVACRLHFDNGRLSIDTENAGRSIPPEVLSHLFEPFATGNEAGHGLGLWVTYQIVTQLGGQIGVESAEGITRFHVELPAGESA
jgi:signal transduction histidine kinase